MVLRRWGEYAFIRPGREMLFSKVDKESKYKAKNLIDVAVYRIADAGFAQLKKFLEAAWRHRQALTPPASQRSGRSTAGGSAPLREGKALAASERVNRRGSRCGLRAYRRHATHQYDPSSVPELHVRRRYRITTCPKRLRACAASQGRFFNGIRDHTGHARELGHGGVGRFLLVRQRDAEARVFARLRRDADAPAGLAHEVAHHVHADAARRLH